MPTRPLVTVAALFALLLGVAGSTALAAADSGRAKASRPSGAGTVLHVPQSVRRSLHLRGARLRARPRTAAVHLLAAAPAPGEQRVWLGLDTVHGALYPKLFAFRGAGRHIEVWVAGDLAFQPGDCRNGIRTQVSDAQVRGLIAAFDRVIHPRMATVFGTPPARDGTAALVGPPFQPRGAGDRVVVLVDNIRDESYFDLDNSQSLPYGVGLYVSQLDDLFDRNTLTIDAYDWLHRTGPRPPHEPSSDPCADAPAWPHLIEGVFAHEYQHLLGHHEDPDEAVWVDEGLAEWSRSLTGYADPEQPVSELGYDRHTQCFLGNLPELAGGPENSLTLWGDGGDVNCEYGAAYSFMEHLHDRYGRKVMTALHRADANGLAGLQEALGRRADARSVLHDWVADLGLRRDLNWDSAHAHSAPGAPPNGGDFVRLRDASGRPLAVRDLRSLSFDGATSLPGRPVEWIVDASPPNGGGAALYSGAGNDLDRSIVRRVSVPTGATALTFEAQWNAEEDPTGGWDFTFVQVSTDGGATYASVSCTSSRTDVSPHARPVMAANLPGYTAHSGGWRTESCDLAAFAGQTVHLAFRHLTDGSVAGDPDDPTATIPPGFWLRKVEIGGASLSTGSSLAGWLTPSQARPTAVHDFTVKLVARRDGRGGPSDTVLVPLDAQHDALLSGVTLRRLLPDRAELVGAVVMYDEPTETVAEYASYALRANGVLQPGG